MAPFTLSSAGCACLEGTFFLLLSAQQDTEGGEVVYMSNPTTDADNVIMTRVRGAGSVRRLTYALGHVLGFTKTHFFRIKCSGGAAAALAIPDELPCPSGLGAVPVQKNVYILGDLGEAHALLCYNIPQQEWSVTCTLPNKVDLARTELAAEYTGNSIYIIEPSGRVTEVTDIQTENGKCEVIAESGPETDGSCVFANGVILRQKHDADRLFQFSLADRAWSESGVSGVAAPYDIPLAYDRRSKTLYFQKAGSSQWDSFSLE